MQPLMEAGLDSIGAMELCDILGQRFGITLPVTSIFDHPTPLAFATYLSTILQPSRAQDGDNDDSDTAHNKTSDSAFPLASLDLGLNAQKDAGAVHIVGISCRYPTPSGGSKRIMQSHAINASPFASSLRYTSDGTIGTIDNSKVLITLTTSLL